MLRGSTWRKRAPERGSVAGMSADAITIVAVGAALLAVIVPLLLSMRRDVAEVRRDLHTLGERVARIEGRLDALTPLMTPPRPAVAPVEPAPAPASAA